MGESRGWWPALLWQRSDDAGGVRFGAERGSVAAGARRRGALGTARTPDVVGCEGFGADGTDDEDVQVGAAFGAGDGNAARGPGRERTGAGVASSGG